MTDPQYDEELPTFEFPEVRRRLFVDALFASGFRTAEAMRFAGYRGKNLADRGRYLMRREDVRADVAERFAKLEREDPRFASEAILNELVEVAFMLADEKTLPSKLRALELLGKWRKLFVERTEIDLAVSSVEQFLLKRHAARNGNGVSA